MRSEGHVFHVGVRDVQVLVIKRSKVSPPHVDSAVSDSAVSYCCMACLFWIDAAVEHCHLSEVCSIGSHVQFFNIVYGEVVDTKPSCYQGGFSTVPERDVVSVPAIVSIPGVN